MADNPAVYSGSDGTAITVATDEVAGAQHQLVIVEWGLPDTATRVSLADPLPVQGAVVFGSTAVLDGGDGHLTTPSTGLPIAALVQSEGSPDFWGSPDGTMQSLVMNDKNQLYVTFDKPNNGDFGTVYAAQSGTWSFSPSPASTSASTIDAGDITVSVSTYQAVMFTFDNGGDGDWNPEGTIDGTNWFPVAMYPIDGSGGGETVLHLADAGTGWFATVAGLASFRVRLSGNTPGSFYAAIVGYTTGTAGFPDAGGGGGGGSVDDGGGSLTVDTDGGPLGVSGVVHDNISDLALADDTTHPLNIDYYGNLKVNIAGIYSSDPFATIDAADHYTGVAFTTNADRLSAIAAVRKNTAAALQSVDGTYTPLQVNSTGSLRTEVTTSALPTGAATSAAQTDKSQFTKITDGTDTALVTGSGEMNVLATAQPGVDIGDVTINNASGASAVPIQDGGNSLTVDNAGTFAVQADTELTTADLDTGAGTDTRAVVGIVGSKSGGAALIPGDATAGLKVDLGADNDVTVTNVTATNLKAQAEVYQGGTAVSSSTPLEVNVRSVTGSSLALDATLTGGTQKSKLVDTGGTNVASVSAAGALKVDASSVAVPITDNSGTLTVDAPVGTPVFVRLSDGSAAITTLPVSLASLPSGAVTNAGTFAVQAEGNTAEDNALAGNPVRLGVRASTTLPTAMSTNGDVVTPWADRSGTMIMGARATSSQPSTIQDANGAPLTMTQRGALWTQATAQVKVATVTPTISTSAYTAGDQLHSSTAMSFSSLHDASGRPVQIIGATLLDKSSQNAATELWLWYSSAPTLANANANDVFSITDANLASNAPVLIIDFAAANYKGTDSNSICQGTWIGGQPLLNSPVLNMVNNTLAGVLVTRGTPTYAGTTDLIVTITSLPL